MLPRTIIARHGRLKLICAALRRGIEDAQTPFKADSNAKGRYDTWLEYKDKKIKYRETRARWLRSGLSKFEWGKVNGVSFEEIHKIDTWLQRDYHHPREQTYHSARAWIFDDSCEPWTFIWMLAQLFNDPMCVANKIREKVRKAQKPNDLVKS
jgi:hypothetical protein